MEEKTDLERDIVEEAHNLTRETVKRIKSYTESDKHTETEKREYLKQELQKNVEALDNLVDESMKRINPGTPLASRKIIRLWALGQIDYEGDLPIRESSPYRLKAIIGEEFYIALGEITNFCLGKPTRHDYIRVIEEQGRAIQASEENQKNET